MGFIEINHTADLALSVWGKDIKSLFHDAAEGMYSLMAAQPDLADQKTRSLTIQGDNHESLLVAFLSELLYIAEFEKTVFADINVAIEDHVLIARLEGYGILSIQRMIKAVTFHKLEITNNEGDFQVEIVFDV